MKRILFDMDGVLVNFEQGFLDEWRRAHPDLPYISLEARNTFYPGDQYPEEHRDLVYEIIDRPYFYGSLPPIAGGREALESLLGLGHDVRICTSPSLSNYTGCVFGKFAWIHRYLGREWLHRLILTKDKTVVAGNVLVDDKPVISGVAKPAWEHVLYDQPYNRNIAERRRITWNNWREILLD